MNKQELINKIGRLYTYGSKNFIERKEVIDLVKQLDETQKVTIPQFVAGWMNYCKLTGVDLYHAFEMNDLYLGNYAYQKDYPKLKGYFESEKNQEIFARAWLDGYTVEEKRYTVKIKAILGQYLERYYLNNEELTPQFKRTQYTGDEGFPTFTRSELEQAGFGWVFDCPGVEIEEVQDDTKL